MKKVIIALLVVASLFAFVSCKEAEPEVVEFTVGVGTYTHNPAAPKAFEFTTKIESVKGQYTVTAAQWATLTSTLTNNKGTCFAIVPTFSGDTSDDASYSWTVAKNGEEIASASSFDTAEKIIAQGNSWYGTRSILDKNEIDGAGTYVYKFEVEKKSGLVENYYFEVIVK